MEEAGAADQGEYNDATSPPSLPVVLQYLYQDNTPSTPLFLPSCMRVSFLQFQLQFFRAGNHVDFPSGRAKTYWKHGIPCAVIGLMLALSRCPPGRDISKAALL